MQKFYSLCHDLIHFSLRREEGFRSPLDARQDVRYSFRGNLVLFHDLSSHCFGNALDMFIEVFYNVPTPGHHLEVIGSLRNVFSLHMGVMTRWQ